MSVSREWMRPRKRPLVAWLVIRPEHPFHLRECSRPLNDHPSLGSPGSILAGQRSPAAGNPATGLWHRRPA